MFEGVTPFQGSNYDEVFKNILARKLYFPPEMNEDGMDLID